MQTEVPTLPVVHFNAHKNLNRKQNSNLGRPSVETKINSSYKNIAYLSSKKKNLHPLLVRPYQSNVRQCPSLEQSKPNKSSIEQRVLSAKMLRIKELQNQLADAHYRLNELATENKLLRALQKRQDSALKRYEGTNAELPRIINSHHEELRVLQIKYKKLKTSQKETCNLLKEKENELQQLQSQNKHLLQLSKDRNLGEREKLQIEVSDLNHRIQQQQDTIQTLHKKLTLETKSLKQQLHLEISKRRETQKHLDETTEKLRSLENLLDNRERRLYYSGQLSFPDKNRRFGTQSLTNLRDISSSNPLKIPSKNKKWQADIQKDSLPMLHTSELDEKNIKTEEKIISNQTLDCIKSETMTNLEQVRRYRLQKSPYKNILNNSEEESREIDFAINENSEFSIDLERSEQLEKQHKEEEKYQINAVKFRKIYNNRKCQNFISSSGGSESENENEHENDKNNYTNATNNSKQLHARLISSADDTSDSKDSDCKYRNKLRVLVRERKNSYVSDSEIESEIRKQSIEHYLTVNHHNDTLKLISSVYDNQAHCDSDKETEKFTSSKNILNESQNVYQSLIDEMHIQTKNVENENIYAQYDIHTEYKNSGNIENYMFGQAPSKIQEFNNVSIKKDDFKNESSLQTYFKDDFKNESSLQTYFKDEHDASFKTNNIEPVDIESKISHTNETLFNGKQKRSSTQDLLNSSQNLNKATINKVDTTEVGILSENILLQNYSLETKNKLNKNEFQNVDMISHNVQSHDNDSVHDILTDVSTMSESNIKTKMADYNKEKLLASMKAIDNNENIEFLNQDYEKHNVTRRKQMIENVFPDLPSHMKKKQEIIKDIFDTDVIKNESTDNCNKLH